MVTNRSQAGGDQEGGPRPQRVLLHLRIRVTNDNHASLLTFLREAVPFYEAPSGIKVRLLRNRNDPTSFIEVVEYTDACAFLADQERVASDAVMQRYLDRWRTLLADRVQVEVYDDISDQIQPPETAP